MTVLSYRSSLKAGMLSFVSIRVSCTLHVTERLEDGLEGLSLTNTSKKKLPDSTASKSRLG